jgi:UDP-N-acetylglucosamine--N-acetylmuramyl-(pentapeptide) pyrophosphoryl-undecaprenol N-acetylglucosamine transferase
MVYLPDIEPGLAVRFISHLATRVAVTVPDAQHFFPARKVTVTGYPVRAALGSVDRNTARASLGLAGGELVVLVFGGSSGARGINRALGDVLEQVLDLAQIVHVSGEWDWGWVSERKEALPGHLKPRYHIAPYLHTEELGAAFAAADLAICRGGASTLGELPYFGLPAVVVPYPHAWRYQRTNADWLARRGAAIRLDEERLAGELVPTLRNLLLERDTLRTMRECMRSLAQPDAASRLAAELRALAG